EFNGRERTATDLFFCGLTPYIASFYNGTVEGQPAVDSERNVLYVGRGDGKLYAVDPDAGRINWRYQTFNPKLPEDPDGGGEIISSPVIGPGGTIYCGTWGIGPYETNAFYGISPDGSLQWRFPSDSSLTDRLIFVSPAISPDQSTIYFGTFFAGDADTPAKLFALNLQPESSVSNEQRLKWDLELINDTKPVWTTTLAVGHDGTLYVGGLFIDGIGNRPVVFAVEDNGALQLKWSTPFVSLDDGAQWVGGIALREIADQTVRLYVATTKFP
ncbi:PQQ-binding-like beta-propeller repeat protein, partial [bacterium]|nr:PQQ-binding-like beta-propeller repeat protein [bacterium]